MVVRFMAGTWRHEDGEERQITTNDEASEAIHDGFVTVDGEVELREEPEP